MSTGPIFIRQISVARISTHVYLDITETGTFRESSLTLQLFHYGLMEDAGLASILAKNISSSGGIWCGKCPSSSEGEGADGDSRS
jgi:hypothetical protein